MELDSLYRCLDWVEIQTWFRNNRIELAHLYKCVTPSAFSMSKFSSFREEDIWTFYLWTRPATSKIFVKKVLPALGFTISWTTYIKTISYKENDHGCDSYISMPKKYWPIMAVYERLST